MKTRVSLGAVVVLAMSLLVPQAAVADDRENDPTVASSLWSVSLESSPTVTTGQDVEVGWRVVYKPATQIEVSFTDRIGRMFQVRQQVSGYSGTVKAPIAAPIVSGPLTVNAVTVWSGPGMNVRYPATGGVYPYPSGATARRVAPDLTGLSFEFNDTKKFAVEGTPTIVGSPTVGSTVRVDPGVWDPQVFSETTWFLDGEYEYLDGLQEFRLRPEDVGKELSATVYVYTPSMSLATYATAAPVVVREGVQQTPSVKISGEVKIGSTVTASVSRVDKSATLAYQWLRDGAPIDGAVASTFKVTGDEVSRALSVRVTSSMDGYADASADSPATVVQPIPFPAATTPTITGAAQGQLLTAKTGTWGVAGTQFSYQWFWNGRAIPGATAKTHAVRGSDLGREISVEVTGTKPGYVAQTLRSIAVVPRR